MGVPLPAFRCAHAGKVGVLRATCGMPRPLRSKGHAQKKIKN
ncbi:MAG: hypothetical protein NZ519_08210 [Bacteroidia bacterium]|nr:hypothetical protein [Bacteroidia bacterium]